MNGLAIVGMIGYFLLGYLVVAAIVFVMFFVFEWNRMGRPKDLDFWGIVQIAQSLMAQPLVFGFLYPFLWFMSLWGRNNDQDK